MKIHCREILKRNIQFLLFLGLSLFCFVTCIVCLKVLVSTKKPTIIAIDLNGTRLVSSEADPIFKTEATAFIKKYLFNIYNFNSNNFMQRIGYATSLMSEDLWNKKRSEVLDLKAKVERDEISLSGEIQKLTLDESGQYHALIEVIEKSRLNEMKHLVGAVLSLKKVDRSGDSPYGLEVDLYEENIVKP